MPLLRLETKSFVEEGSAGKDMLDSDSLKRCGSVPVSVSKLEAEYVVETSSMEAVACSVELLSVELLVEKREDVTLVGFRVISESVDEVLEVGGGGSLVAGEYLVVEMDFFDAVAFVVGFDIDDVDSIFGVVAVFDVDSACDDDVNLNV